MGDHTECIQVDFDPAIVSFTELLDEFFAMHNATRLAHSDQYASLILHIGEDQGEAAAESAGRYGALLGAPVMTQIRPLDRFYVAEDCHQKYGLRNDRTLLAEMQDYYPDEARLRESTAAMRLNGFAYNGGRASLLASEIESYGLSEAGELHLRGIVGRR